MSVLLRSMCSFSFFFYFLFVCLFGFLRQNLHPMLASNSMQTPCLSLLRVGSTGVNPHAQLFTLSKALPKGCNRRDCIIVLSAFTLCGAQGMIWLPPANSILASGCLTQWRKLMNKRKLLGGCLVKVSSLLRNHAPLLRIAALVWSEAYCFAIFLQTSEDQRW